MRVAFKVERRDVVGRLDVFPDQGFERVAPSPADEDTRESIALGEELANRAEEFWEVKHLERCAGRSRSRGRAPGRRSDGHSRGRLGASDGREESHRSWSVGESKFLG